MSGSATYWVWADMKKRCTDPAKFNYKDYGGRGITVCKKWLAFEGFYADMGTKPEGMSLDRINNDGPYSLENCRWATSKEQSRNRRPNHFITHNGKTQCLSDWASEIGIDEATLGHRIKRGWPLEVAMTKAMSRADASAFAHAQRKGRT